MRGRWPDIHRRNFVNCDSRSSVEAERAQALSGRRRGGDGQVVRCGVAQNPPALVCDGRPPETSRSRLSCAGRHACCRRAGKAPAPAHPAAKDEEGDASRTRQRRNPARVQSSEVLAPRTIRNVYSTLRALFRDAMIEELIEGTPCVLSDSHLPAAKDKDPEWRDTAVFTPAEVATLLYDPAIPMTGASATRCTSWDALGSGRRRLRGGVYTNPRCSRSDCCALPAAIQRG
jgi:hypothetical protein